MEEGLSEAKLSCPLPIPVFSVSPDFVVFPASWSGADASHTSALNTSSTHLLRGFRTFFRLSSSHTNPDLLINSIDRYLEQGFFSVQFFHTVIFREGHVYIHLVSGVSSDKLVFEIVNIAS